MEKGRGTEDFFFLRVPYLKSMSITGKAERGLAQSCRTSAEKKELHCNKKRKYLMNIIICSKNRKLKDKKLRKKLTVIWNCHGVSMTNLVQSAINIQIKK